MLRTDPMVSIAREAVLYDKLRFAITAVSLAFAIVLIVWGGGMFFSVIGETVKRFSGLE